MILINYAFPELTDYDLNFDISDESWKRDFQCFIIWKEEQRTKNTHISVIYIFFIHVIFSFKFYLFVKCQLSFIQTSLANFIATELEVFWASFALNYQTYKDTATFLLILTNSSEVLWFVLKILLYAPIRRNWIVSSHLYSNFKISLHNKARCEHNTLSVVIREWNIYYGLFLLFIKLFQQYSYCFLWSVSPNK